MTRPGFGHLSKRLLDIVGAACALAIASPLFAFLSILITLDSGGPVFYKRRVVGRGGTPFDALKFRTMVVNAEEVLRLHPDLSAEYQKNVKLKDDPRVTRVGRWLRRLSLDELPQLLNVLYGQMSLVGPRIVAPHELSRYAEFQTKRLSFRPGMTGLWQVSGRQDISYENRIRIDMEYVDNWSVWLDLRILLRTVPAVLKMRGAY